MATWKRGFTAHHLGSVFSVGLARTRLAFVGGPRLLSYAQPQSLHVCKFP